MVLAFAGDSTITSLRPLVRDVVATGSLLAPVCPSARRRPPRIDPATQGRVVTTVTPPDRLLLIRVGGDRRRPGRGRRAAAGRGAPRPAPPAGRRARPPPARRTARRRRRRPGRPARCRPAPPGAAHRPGAAAPPAGRPR